MRGSSGSASATPDVGKQKYEGLAKEFGKPSAQSGLGGVQPAADDNFLTASWKKTTGTIAGVFATKPPGGSDVADPLRLDQPSKKPGPEIHVGAAQLMENQGKFAEAEAHYQKALQLAPNDLNALVGLARLQDRQGHSQQALQIYQRAYKAHPQSGLVLNDVALCHARQRQFDLAMAAINRACELSPDNPKYRNNQATILVECGHVDEAVQKLSVGSSLAVAHYNVGYLLQQKGQTGDATRHLQQALAIDPSLGPAREMLAQLTGAAPAEQQPQVDPRTAPPRYETARAPAATAAVRQPQYDLPSVDVPASAQPAAVAGTQSYHFSDEAPAAGTPTNWGAYGTQHLPPVE
jgi:tetratricopeptide (TPR) repeat protein